MLYNKIVPNLSVFNLERLLSLLLCMFLLQYKVTKTSLQHHLNNLFYSVFTLICVIVTIGVLLFWEMLYKICSKQIYKYSGTLNYLLKTT